MQIGDKVTVIKNPNNKEKTEGVKQTRFAKIHQNGILESISSNVIVIKYKNYRESFNIADIVQRFVEIQDKHHNKLTPQDFKEMIKNGKRIIQEH